MLTLATAAPRASGRSSVARRSIKKNRVPAELYRKLIEFCFVKFWCDYHCKLYRHRTSPGQNGNYLSSHQDMSSRPLFSTDHGHGLRFCRGSIFLHDFPFQRPWSSHTMFLKLYEDTGEFPF